MEIWDSEIVEVDTATTVNIDSSSEISYLFFECNSGDGYVVIHYKGLTFTIELKLGDTKGMALDVYDNWNTVKDITFNPQSISVNVKIIKQINL